jgi:hypothetical protein
MPRLHLEYEQWYTQASELVATLLPARYSAFNEAYARISRYLLDHQEKPGVTSRILYRTSLLQQIGILLSARNAILDDSVQLDVYDSIELVCHKFHDVAKQITERHSGRQSLIITDEYDVQDLLHALLKLFFEDIRSEEWTPSYAGKSSRMDFLLKNEAIVIETKKTRMDLKDKEIGDQLIIDIERYKSHPTCKQLVCFIYDPEELLKNPKGLQNDLNRDAIDLVVKVLINPKRN